MAGKIVHRAALREGENVGAHRGREGGSGVDSGDAGQGKVLSPRTLVPAASLRTDTQLVLPELVAHLVDRVRQPLVVQRRGAVLASRVDTPYGHHSTRYQQGSEDDDDATHDTKSRAAAFRRPSFEATGHRRSGMMRGWSGRGTSQPGTPRSRSPTRRWPDCPARGPSACGASLNRPSCRCSWPPREGHAGG